VAPDLAAMGAGVAPPAAASAAVVAGVFEQR
jgi:hypothetical protein